MHEAIEQRAHRAVPARTVMQRASNAMTDPGPPGADVTGVLTNGSGNHQARLPPRLRNGIEQLSGIGMDDVRVHFNSKKPAQLKAHAYTQGSDIHLGPGQERHLAHEAWHVVQQKQGRVRPTAELGNGQKLNDDSGLEHEADRMGERALGLSRLGPVQRRAIGGQRGTPAFGNVFQLKKDRTAAIDAHMNTNVSDRALKSMIVQVFNKVKAYVNAQNIQINDRGRDAYFYTGIRHRNRTMTEHLDNWNANDKSASDTAAMLMDFALKWKNLNSGHNNLSNERYHRRRLATNVFTNSPKHVLLTGDLGVLNQQLAALQNQQNVPDADAHGQQVNAKQAEVDAKQAEIDAAFRKRARLLGTQASEARGNHHNFVAQSDLGQHAANQGYSTQAGPSASTAQLLWFLRAVGGVSQSESHAVALALSEYWGGTLKRNFGGGYHTKFEAMIPLARQHQHFGASGYTDSRILKNCNLRDDNNVNQVLEQLHTNDNVEVQWHNERRFSLGTFSTTKNHVWVRTGAGRTGWVVASNVAHER